MENFWRAQPVLITGVSGFLGAHLAEMLVEKGAEVVGVRRDLERTSYLSLNGLDRKITMCSGDVVDLSRMREIIASYGVKYIFHCAAHSVVKHCATDPVGCFNANIMGTVSVLEAARDVGGVAGAMVMESDKAYGSSEVPYKEGQAINPTGVYEVSKACAGLIAMAYAHNYDLPVYTIRAANLYGPGDMNVSRIIPNSILRILRNESPVLYGPVADYVREFIYVDDAARAIINLMERIDVTAAEVFNLSTSEHLRIEDMIHMVCSLMGSQLKPEIIPKDSRFTEIREQYMDHTKLKACLPDFSPRSLHSGLEETILWYRKHFEAGTLL